jgi:TonB family protein
MAPVPAPDPDGFYDVASSSLKRLESSPKLMFPPELSAHEVADRVVAAVTIAPDGTVKTAKVVSGRYRELKETVEKTVQKWAFQPYVVNGAPVPVRTGLLSISITLSNITAAQVAKPRRIWIRNRRPFWR